MRAAAVDPLSAVAELLTVSNGAVRTALVDKTVEPEPVEVVVPVPPFATASVPARVTAPVVADDGVKPVVPAENEDTFEAGADQVAVVPLEVSTVAFAPIASGVYAEVDEPTGIEPTAGAVAVPVPPLVTERVPTELARLLLAVMYH